MQRYRLKHSNTTGFSAKCFNVIPPNFCSWALLKNRFERLGRYTLQHNFPNKNTFQTQDLKGAFIGVISLRKH
ncbi:TPA: hypothetical protein JI302_18970 [Acinetobacter baumannii]|nr:hypothetical protein [Acinetobacter baumannii]